jgi:hypothetical protein
MPANTSELHIIDLSPLLRDLEQQIADAEQEARIIQLKLARLRGLRDGVLMAVEQAQQAPIVRNGIEEARPVAPQEP